MLTSILGPTCLLRKRVLRLFANLTQGSGHWPAAAVAVQVPAELLYPADHPAPPGGQRAAFHFFLSAFRHMVSKRAFCSVLQGDCHWQLLPLLSKFWLSYYTLLNILQGLEGSDCFPSMHIPRKRVKKGFSCLLQGNCHWQAAAAAVQVPAELLHPAEHPAAPGGQRAKHGVCHRALLPAIPV